MKTIPFIIQSTKNNLDALSGVIINDTANNKARVTFLTDLIVDKDIDSAIVENPEGFLYTYLTNNTNLYQQGYDTIMLEGEKKFSLKPKSEKETCTVFVSPTGFVLTDTQTETLKVKLGKKVFNQIIESREIPNGNLYVKDSAMNSILSQNNLCIHNIYYQKNKKEIHRHISLYLNGKLSDDVVAINMKQRSIKKHGLLNDKQLSKKIEASPLGIHPSHILKLI